MSDLVRYMSLIPWWGWCLSAVAIAILGYTAHWQSVRQTRRRAVPPIVQGTTHIQKADDDEWKRLRVFRWWGHVWIWVPLDLCTGLTDRTVDEGDAADEIATVWRGRSAGDPTRRDIAGSWRVFHVQRGRRS